MMHKVRRIHFVGIGGIGMSGIAQLLCQQGYQVSGSDLKTSAWTDKLQQLGVQLFFSHQADHVRSADVVVISSAVNLSNPEVVEAHRLGIPVILRAQMLAELMRGYFGIAITGTHGKSTTSALIAHVLEVAKLSPSYVVGAQLSNTANNAGLGESAYFVAEADESDASFLNLNPIIEVITNIDVDHMQTYQQDVSCLKQAFIDFINKLPFYGVVAVCIDSPLVKEILPQLSGRKIVTYGMDPLAQYQVKNIRAQGMSQCFDVQIGTKLHLSDIKLSLAGHHNAVNALSAIIVADELKISESELRQAFQSFLGISRRFQYYGELRLIKNHQDIHIDLIDDYAHHPVEIVSTLQAIRSSFPNRRVLLIFQPHRYSRTQDCFEELAQALSQADVLVIDQVYAAGESLIEGADSASLANRIRQINPEKPLELMATWQDFIPLSLQICKADDVVVTMGAGSIGHLALELSSLFKRGEQNA